MLWAISYAQLKIQEDSLLVRLESASDKEKKADFLIELSKLCRNSDLKKSIEYGEQALKIASEGKDTRIKADAYTNMGILLYFCENYVKTLEMFLTARTIYEEIEDNEGRVYINNCMGNVYSSMNDFEYAMKCYTTALQISNEIRENGDTNYQIMPGIYANIGMTYFNIKDYKTARDYTLKAVALSEKEKSKNLGIYYNNLSNMYRNLGDTAECLAYIRMARNWNIQNDDKLGVARAELSAASCFMELKKYKEAEPYIRKAFRLGSELGASYILQDAYKLRSDYKRHFGDFEGALKDLEESYRHKEKLLGEEKIQAALKLKFAADYKIKEKQYEYEREQANMRNNIQIILFVFIVFVFGAVFYIIRLRLKRVKLEKENLQKDLELKNKELISKIMFLMEKNELINEVSNKLIEIRGNLKAENKVPIQQLIMNLRGALDDGLWQSFETHFNHVYESFYERLSKEFPDLTPTELRICAFLRLNLSTKEISSLLNLSAGSVDVMRARIRKKIKLTDSRTNLVGFLLKY